MLSHHAVDFSDFFPYITGTDKGYHSQCHKLVIFPNLETKISQIICQKNRPLTSIVVFFSLMRCTSYFSVLNRKYRSLQCTWSLAYDYSWYLITANITRERLMHLVLFFTYQFDIICTLIKNPISFDFRAIFHNWMGTGTSTNG